MIRKMPGNRKSKLRLPDCANGRFWIQEDGTLGVALIVSEEERRYFRDKKEEMKSLTFDINDWGFISKKNLKALVQSYIICNLAMGMIDKELAKIQMSPAGNGKYANDGNHRQHWIPECYMKPFFEDGSTRKVSRDLISNFSDEDLKKFKESGKLGKFVDMKHPDFCEPKNNKGEMYDHHYELFLSKVEGDYAAISKGVTHSDTLWEFIVLSSFFFILRCRTKEMKESLHPAWKYQKELLIDAIPEIISNLEIIRLGIGDVLPGEEGHKTFPFTQHPVFTVRERLKVSLWSIYTPECMIWFRNKYSKYKVKNLWKFSQEMLFSLVGDETTRDLYFKPSDIPWSMHVAPPKEMPPMVKVRALSRKFDHSRTLN